MYSRSFAAEGPGPILVAEDSRDDALLLELAFTKAAPRVPVFFVYDGEEMAAYLLGTEPFSDRATHPFPGLLLVDLRMPHMSGLEFLAWLRSHEDLNRMPVIVLTGTISPAELRRAYELGADLCLKKPQSFDQLVAIAQTAEIYLRQYPHLVKEDCILPAMGRTGLSSLGATR